MNIEIYSVWWCIGHLHISICEYSATIFGYLCRCWIMWETPLGPSMIRFFWTLHLQRLISILTNNRWFVSIIYSADYGRISKYLGHFQEISPVVHHVISSCKVNKDCTRDFICFEAILIVFVQAQYRTVAQSALSKARSVWWQMFSEILKYFDMVHAFI